VRQEILRTTYITKPLELKRKWFLIDASDLILGRLASHVAKILRGKNKTCFAPNQDTGDYIIIINADKIRVTGKKLNQKIYTQHSGYTGGVKKIILKDMLVRRPEFALKHAIKGMLPKNNLGHAMLKKLFIYKDNNHKHEAQKPVILKLNNNNF
jgi:large subunit ribosomal protein L13